MAAKKNNYFIASVVIVIVLFSGIFMIFHTFNTKELPPAPTEMQLGDFENNQEGMFNGQLNNNYDQEEVDPVVVLFSSATVPGVNLIYYHYENKVVVGTPQMVVENVILFNDRPHWVGYTFKEGEKQYFFYDGEVVASSEFEPPQENSLTGFVTGAAQSYVYEGFENFEIK
ncbi:MAG: hypothetical protein Q8R37_00575 [Nanoarchaeota archaeon]|nr:hypothetical protein [Nanoarchaeota archaeon]